jgi:hypothetical protein
MQSLVYAPVIHINSHSRHHACFEVDLTTNFVWQLEEIASFIRRGLFARNAGEKKVLFFAGLMIRRPPPRDLLTQNIGGEPRASGAS